MPTLHHWLKPGIHVQRTANYAGLHPLPENIYFCMYTMPQEVTYPVKEIFKAINALRPTFNIEGVDHLYVDFDQVRSESSFQALMFKLGILDGVVSDEAGYAKILFTGHTGSGKSTELRKLHRKLHKPDLYFSVYLDIEEYIQISEYKSDDLIVFLIASLVNALEECGVDALVPSLQKIANEWLSEKEVSDEVKRKMESEGGISGEVSTGKLLPFFTAKAFLKSVFSYGSHTSETVRRKIQEKQGTYISDFNIALQEVRRNIRLAGQGKEIVFLIDGFEKLRQGNYETYKKVFVQDTRVITDLNCGFVCCVPIDTRYDPHMSQVLTVYEAFTLPLLPVNPTTESYFCDIITKRIDKDTFFEAGVLEYCVSMSGGSPRQLVRIVSDALALSQSNHFRINRAIAEKACFKLGDDLQKRLQTPHFELLKSGNYAHADPLILELLYTLSLMEYNGEINKRLPNPLLVPFLQNS